MSRIKKIVFAALAAAALTGAAGAVHLDRPVQGSSSVSAGIQSSSAASEVVRLTNSVICFILQIAHPSGNCV